MLGKALAIDMGCSGADPGGGLVAATGMGVCWDVNEEVVGPWVSVTDGWARSGDGRLCPALSAVGGNKVVNGVIVGWTILVDGDSEAGLDNPGASR